MIMSRSDSTGMEGMEQVWNPESVAGQAISIPSIPSTPFPSHMHMGERVRAHACARVCEISKTGMEGMEGMEQPAFKRVSRFHTSNTGVEGVEHG